MTDEQAMERVNKLINHNGGWMVSTEPDGRRAKKGDIVPISLPSGRIFSVLVLGPATEQEAQADCDALGLPFVKKSDSYVKVMVD